MKAGEKEDSRDAFQKKRPLVAAPQEILGFKVVPEMNQARPPFAPGPDLIRSLFEDDPVRARYDAFKEEFGQDPM